MSEEREREAYELRQYETRCREQEAEDMAEREAYETPPPLVDWLRATFDPGGSLPEDCAHWVAQHDAAIDRVAALLSQLRSLRDTWKESYGFLVGQIVAYPSDIGANDRRIDANRFATCIEQLDALLQPPTGSGTP